MIKRGCDSDAPTVAVTVNSSFKMTSDVDVTGFFWNGLRARCDRMQNDQSHAPPHRTCLTRTSHFDICAFSRLTCHRHRANLRSLEVRARFPGYTGPPKCKTSVLGGVGNWIPHVWEGRERAHPEQLLLVRWGLLAFSRSMQLQPCGAAR